MTGITFQAPAIIRYNMIMTTNAHHRPKYVICVDVLIEFYIPNLVNGFRH